MSHSSTLRNSRYWIDLYITDVINEKIFKVIDIPSDDAWGKLMKAIQDLLNAGIEVGALSIYDWTKDHVLVGMYMQACQETEKLTREKIHKEAYNETHPENISAEAYRQTLLKMLQDIKENQKK